MRSALSEAIRMLLQAYTMNLVHIPYWILFIAQEEICKWPNYRAFDRSFFFNLGKERLNYYIFYDRILNLYLLFIFEISKVTLFYFIDEIWFIHFYIRFEIVCFMIYM